MIGGRCVKFGDSVNTDLIMPGRYLVSIDPAELAEHVFEPLGPQVQARVRSSKVVVAGRNFGCGSHERAGKAELTARLGGAEDVNVYCHSSTADADTVEVVSEYRGYWTGAARVLAKGDCAWAGPLAAGYQAAAALAAGATAAAVRAAGRAALAALGPDARVDLMQHTDLETDGGYRYRADGAEPLADGAVVTLRVELGLADGSAAGLADTFEVGSATAACLTAAAGPVLGAGADAAAW